MAFLSWIFGYFYLGCNNQVCCKRQQDSKVAQYMYIGTNNKCVVEYRATEGKLTLTRLKKHQKCDRKSGYRLRKVSYGAPESGWPFIRFQLAMLLSLFSLSESLAVSCVQHSLLHLTPPNTYVAKGQLHCPPRPPSPRIVPPTPSSSSIVSVTHS